jgi:hypothetical protein
MEAKPDGRLYSQILRKIVAIIQSIPKEKEMTIREFAEDIHKRQLPVFYLKRFGKSVSVERIGDYLRYLREIKILNAKENKFVLNFTHKKTDEEWAQALSDRALEHLSEIIEKPPNRIPNILESRRKRILKSRHVPTIENIILDLEIEGGRTKEIFRWSLYVYIDGPTCPFDIRRHPILSSTLEEE